MTQHRGVDIRQQLAETLAQIKYQMEEIRQEAQLTQTPPVSMRDEHGNYIWASLICAKAQVLHALVLVNQK